MMIRWVGAMLILLAGGGFGFLTARSYSKEEKALMDLITIADFMIAELSCRLTPLPELCTLAARQGKSSVCKVFSEVSEELYKNTYTSADQCILYAVEHNSAITQISKRHLIQLGRNLGRFDLEGQISGIKSVQELCRRDLKGLQSNKNAYLKMYQTIGFCTGLALVILLI